MSIRLAGNFSASASGASSCGPCVSMRGQPASRISSSRSASFSASSAVWSCSRQRLRSARFVDQSLSSKARRAASMARCMSAFDASATSPRTSSVAGLRLANVPASPSTSLPSISILGSKRSLGLSDMVARSRWMEARGVLIGSSSPKRATRWELTPSGSSLASHEVAGAHPGSPAPLPERDPGARSAGRGGQHLHALERLLHAAGAERMGVGERAQERGGDVAVHHRQAVLGASPVRRLDTGRGSAGRRGWPRRTGRCRSNPVVRST